MKKFFVMLMSLVMVFAFTACGSSDSGAAEEQAEPEVEETVDITGTYVWTEYTLDDVEQALAEDAAKIVIKEDGTYDFISAETSSGTYTFDGEATLTTSNGGDFTVVDNTLVQEGTGDDGVVWRLVYTKTE